MGGGVGIMKEEPDADATARVPMVYMREQADASAEVME